MEKILSYSIPPNILREAEDIRIEIVAKMKDSSSGKWDDLQPLDVENDKDLIQLSWNKYYTEIFEKYQVVLHHTVSGPGISGDVNHWSTFSDHIAVCIIIDREGKMHQLFSSKYWGYHLGCGNSSLDKHSIAVELDNWGQLHEKNGQLYTIYNSEVDVPTVTYPNGFRGEQIFEAYPEAQIRALGELLLLWNKSYNIPLDYNEDMWDVSDRALNNKPGIWSHVSYRSSGKWDVHPDPELIDMLKSLSR